VIDDADDRIFTAREAREIAGLSYRQLNDWEAKGSAPFDSSRGAKWRRFSPAEMFALLVCSELRQRFGLPVEQLRFVQETLLDRHKSYFDAAAELVLSDDVAVWLITDGVGLFIFDSEPNIVDLVKDGFLDGNDESAHLWIRVSPLLKRVLDRLNDRSAEMEDSE
jgi:hypothetical protein